MTAVIAKTPEYTIETLLAIARGEPTEAFSHTRKLIKGGFIKPTYAKETTGPGRPRRTFVITENGNKYLRLNFAGLDELDDPKYETPRGEEPIGETGVTLEDIADTAQKAVESGLAANLDATKAFVADEVNKQLRSIIEGGLANSLMGKGITINPPTPHKRRGRKSSSVTKKAA